MNSESGPKDFKYLQEYFKEFTILLKQGTSIMDLKCLYEIDHMNGLFLIFRQLLISNGEEFIKGFPGAQKMADQVLKIVTEQVTHHL